MHQIEKNKIEALNMSVAILSAWSGLMLALYALIGVSWFHLGDFSFRTAMAYHGILIPAWMMLVLAYSRHIEHSDFMKKLLGTGAVSAGILTGIGSALICGQGFFLGTGIQVTGMILAEITALAIIVQSFRHHFRTPPNGINTFAWWTVSIGLVGLSLATPLGHLAGAVKDLGENLPIFVKHAALLGLSPKAVLSGYIGSHSHQILAAFLAAGFALPLMRKPFGKPDVVSFMEKVGLFVMATATIAQVALYQYCAWFGWKPPVLFSSGPNGLPLDDFVLVVLGLGMLLLIPALLVKDKRTLPSEAYSRFVGGIVTILLIAYLISVVALGLYIEFHEQYFGHGAGHALGVLNDTAYIRAHLLFDFMIIPVLLGALLSVSLINTKRQKWFITVSTILVVKTGLIGVFVWTFFLNSLILQISIALTAIFLLLLAPQLAKACPPSNSS